MRIPWNFSFFFFTPGNSRQNKAQPLEIPQNCVRSLGNSKDKIQDPWKFHMLSSLIPLEIPFSEPHPTPTCLFFSGIAHSVKTTYYMPGKNVVRNLYGQKWLSANEASVFFNCQYFIKRLIYDFNFWNVDKLNKRNKVY